MRSGAAPASGPRTATRSFRPRTGLKAGAGSIVAAVAYATSHEPDMVVGKPEPLLFEAAAELAGMPSADAVVIGDNLKTDIGAAIRLGARSVLMLTGVTTTRPSLTLRPTPPDPPASPRRRRPRPRPRGALAGLSWTFPRSAIQGGVFIHSDQVERIDPASAPLSLLRTELSLGGSIRPERLR